MKWIRKLVELVSRNRIISRKIFVNNKKIPVFVSPDAQLKYLKIGKSAFDQDLIDIAEKYINKKSNVWDIGANVGIFTFASSSIVRDGQILSIEADIWLASILRKTANLNYYRNKNIAILPAAVSNKNTIAKFMIAERGRACNALESAGGRSMMGGCREMQYVPTVTLDSLLESFLPPSFIKIDIEGGELLAINGAQNIINNIRPIFYIEIGSDVSEAILEIFNIANYQAYYPNGDACTSLSDCPPNTFFIPREKVGKL